MVERTQPADPLVLNSFQFVTNLTATFSTTLVPSPSQLLLRGGDGVHQGPSEVAEGSVVPWATILEMLVETCVGVVRKYNIFMFNEGLKESIGMTNKSLSNTDSASVSMIVNMDDSEDVDADFVVETEHEITANTRKCY